MVLNLIVQALDFPNLPYCPWDHGEDWLECIFGQARAGHGSAQAFSMAEMIDRLQRAAYRAGAQLSSGLVTTNRRGKRLDAFSRSTMGARATICDELAGGRPLTKEILSGLVMSSSTAAFERVRCSLQELGMLAVLITSGRTELAKDTAHVRHFELSILCRSQGH
jgi:hypothetical protein